MSISRTYTVYDYEEEVITTQPSLACSRRSKRGWELVQVVVGAFVNGRWCELGYLTLLFRKPYSITEGPPEDQDAIDSADGRDRLAWGMKRASEKEPTSTAGVKGRKTTKE